LTLGFDPTRFQTEPPVCYRASWQLPGPDFHRQATTSFTDTKIDYPELIATPPALLDALQILYRLLSRSVSNAARCTPSTPGAPLFALTFWYACQTSHFEISNGFADDFSSFMQLLPGPHRAPVDRTNTATDDPAPSLHPYYRSFSTTTSRSASAPRNGTHTRLDA
jgi:hypothetical protein